VVNDDQVAIEIVAKSGSAYLVPAAEYESWVETACSGPRPTLHT
jgi:antitoxin YefM